MAKKLLLKFAMVLVLVVKGVFGSNIGRALTLERAFPVNGEIDFDQVNARDIARHARILRRFNGGAAYFPLTGSSDPSLSGLYYTKVKLGSPPREFNVQIDTGSDILWVTCSSCNNCPQISGLGIELAFFDATSSTTASRISCSDAVCASSRSTESAACNTENNQCGYSFLYGDGSGTSGIYVSDLVYFDSMVVGPSLIANSSASVVFGCSTSQSGGLTTTDRAVDGIFGFGQQKLSVISQLSSRGITPNIFSHCLKGEDNGGGILVLGEIVGPSFVYTPLVPGRPHYNLQLQSIEINGQALPIDPAVFTSNDRGTIIDSGTTFLYLVEEAYEPVVSAVTAAVSRSAKPKLMFENQCYLVGSSISEIFPSISLNFAGDALLRLRPSDYLVPRGASDDAAVWCLGLVRSQDSQNNILGDIVLKDKIVVYDLAHQRIGWADYNCSLPVNVSITSNKDEFIKSGHLRMSSSFNIVICKVLPRSINTLILHILVFIGVSIL
ncbi:hypothetical protein Leryth_009682 [Lithospermum erythrorhizon]|nr:hypothetical protein Leryth_009682 [Lithospermum erythrorhizon]